MAQNGNFENEIKLVLNPHCENEIRQTLSDGWQKHNIIQSYLGVKRTFLPGRIKITTIPGERIRTIHELFIKITEEQHQALYNGEREDFVKGRIRQTITNGVPAYHFNFKKGTPLGNIEIEHEVQPSFWFDNFDPENNVTIYKQRLEKHIEDEIWSVDIFWKPGYDGNYLIMAEVEMPDGRVTPLHTPDFISDNILHSVERNDERFNNIALSDPNKVLKTLEEIEDKKDVYPSFR